MGCPALCVSFIILQIGNLSEVEHHDNHEHGVNVFLLMVEP